MYLESINLPIRARQAMAAAHAQRVLRTQTGTFPMLMLDPRGPGVTSLRK